MNKTLTSADVLGHSIYDYPLEYINYFDFFPAAISRANQYSEDTTRSYNLVTNIDTANNLKFNNDRADLKEEKSILVKAAEGSNLTYIKNEIRKLQLNVYDIHDIDGYSNDYFTKFITFTLIMNSIAVGIIILMFGFTTAKNIFDQRMRLLETYYRIGINKTQIWLGYQFEIFLVSSLPVLLSVPISMKLVEFLSKYLLRYAIEFHIFDLDFSWWLILVAILVEMLFLFIGWNSLLYFNIQKYKPVKQA